MRLLFLASFFCLFGAQDAVARKFTLTIKVVDNIINDPVANIEVRIGNEMVLTNEQGLASFKECKGKKFEVFFKDPGGRFGPNRKFIYLDSKNDCSETIVMKCLPETALKYYDEFREHRLLEIQKELETIDFSAYDSCDDTIGTSKSYINAQFPGDLRAMQKYIASTLVYPEESIEMEEQGIVYVSFVVEWDGSISDIEIEKSVSKLLDSESYRVVATMPKWIPGFCNGEIIRMRCRLPVVFTLL